MKKEIQDLQLQIEALVERKQDIQKKQLVAYSNNMSQQLFSQLRQQLELVDIELYTLMEIKKEKERIYTNSDDLDGFVSDAEK